MSHKFAEAYFYGSNRAGQSIAWDDPDTTVSRIGLSVKRRGTPGGPLVYHLEQALRCAFRMWSEPSDTRANTGFRCVFGAPGP